MHLEKNTTAFVTIVVIVQYCLLVYAYMHIYLYIRFYCWRQCTIIQQSENEIANRKKMHNE